MVRAAVMLAVIFWMYAGYAWLTNAVAADRASRRIVLLAGMAAFLIVALAVPRAFRGGGLAFGLAYAVVVAVHTGLFTRAARVRTVGGVVRLGATTPPRWPWSSPAGRWAARPSSRSGRPPPSSSGSSSVRRGTGGVRGRRLALRRTARARRAGRDRRVGGRDRDRPRGRDGGPAPRGGGRPRPRAQRLPVVDVLRRGRRASRAGARGRAAAPPLAPGGGGLRARPPRAALRRGGDRSGRGAGRAPPVRHARERPRRGARRGRRPLPGGDAAFRTLLDIGAAGPRLLAAALALVTIPIGTGWRRPPRSAPSSSSSSGSSWPRRGGPPPSPSRARRPGGVRPVHGPWPPRPPGPWAALVVSSPSRRGTPRRPPPRRARTPPRWPWTDGWSR